MTKAYVALGDKDVIATVNDREVEMATDLDEWKAFLTKFGVPFTQDDAPKKDDRAARRLTIEAPYDAAEPGPVVGYPGFITEVDFDAAGKFLHGWAGGGAEVGWRLLHGSKQPDQQHRHHPPSSPLYPRTEEG